MKVEIYSDVACPWCYLGKRRFEQALATYEQDPDGEAVEVVYRPYQLNPEQETRPEPHNEYCARRFGPQAAVMDARFAETARAEGLRVDFDSAVENNTLLAHRLLRHALTEYGHKAQAALKDVLLTAHFADGVDIGDRDALAGLAADAGLDREVAAAFLASEEGGQEVLDEIEAARQLGVTAVPTFVFDGTWAVQGAQPPEAFLSALRQAGGRTLQTG